MKVSSETRVARSRQQGCMYQAQQIAGTGQGLLLLCLVLVRTSYVHSVVCTSPVVPGPAARVR